MIMQSITYYVSGGKSRCNVKHQWWTNRTDSHDGWSNFATVNNKNAAIRLFKRLRVKHRQIDIRGRTVKPRAWLWEKKLHER